MLSPVRYDLRDRLPTRQGHAIIEKTQKSFRGYMKISLPHIDNMNKNANHQHLQHLTGKKHPAFRML